MQCQSKNYCPLSPRKGRNKYVRLEPAETFTVNRKVGVNTSGWLEEGFLSLTISAELDGLTHKYAFTH